VAAQLEQYVLRGGYRPGDKLPSEREFTALLGFSRTAVREAVKQLSQQGLIRSSVGRGLFMAEHSTAALAASIDTALHLGGGRAGDVMEMRHILGTAAARLAAQRATADDLRTMSQAVEEMEGDYQVPGVMARTGSAFHRAVGRAAHNPLLAALYEPVMMLMDRVRRDLPTGGPTKRGAEDHRRLYSAIAARDPEAAAAAMEQHLAYYEQRLTTYIPNWPALPVRR
jgi:DNA-binding FadR family transcriptional regulator